MTHNELVSEVQQEVNQEEALVDELEQSGILCHEEAEEAKREIEEGAAEALAEDNSDLGQNDGPVFDESDVPDVACYDDANNEDFFD